MSSSFVIRKLRGFQNFLEVAEQILIRALKERNLDHVDEKCADTFEICLAINESLDKEGYHITDSEGGSILIEGADQRGLIYGIGKLLRTGQHDPLANGAFRCGNWRGTSVPTKKVRGLYFATHFNNYYHCAPLEEIYRYIEDIALWGYNTLAVWFDMHHFDSLNAPDAQEHIHRLRSILQHAKNIGLDIGLLVAGNEAYASSPEELRADWTTGHDGYFGDCMPMYRVELCPSKPQGFQMLMNTRRQVFEVFSGLIPDYLIIWPYDQGGCSCSDCAPWGGNGFIKIAKPVAQMARELFPDVKVILSTWFFGCYNHEEWKAFDYAINADPSWVNFVMADYPGAYPDFILKNGVPGGIPLLGFPEISMYQSAPWGGFGANPLPRYIETMWQEAGKLQIGGFPYSEGIFEDFNKALVGWLYWEGQGNIADAIEEYCRFSLVSYVSRQLLEIVQDLESTNQRDRLRDGNPEWMPIENADGIEQFQIANDEKIDKIFKMCEALQAILPKHVAGSWRWRIIYLRATIDYHLLHNDFMINDNCEEAFDQLIQIYHAQNSIWAVKPPSRRNRLLMW